MKAKLHYNSPVILTFFFLSLAALVLGMATKGWTTRYLFSVYRSAITPLWFVRLFGRAALEGMPQLAELYQGEIIPSRAFVEGGIHEAIVEYENNVFFDILAEDLARRDMDDAPIDESNYAELASRIEAYINELEQHGTDNILVDTEHPGS